MAYTSGFDPTAQPKPYDPNDPATLDLTNPVAGNRGSGAATSSPQGGYDQGNSYDPAPPDTSSPGPVASAPLPTQPTTPAQTSVGTTVSGTLPGGPGGAGTEAQWASIYAAKPGAFNSPDFWASHISDPTIRSAAAGLAQGLSGESLVNSINAAPGAGGAAYYAPDGSKPAIVALGSGYYMAQDGPGGSWSLIARTPETGGSSGTGGGGNTAGGTGGADIQGLLAQLLAGQDTGRQSAFFDQLQGLAGQYGQPVTADDPIIKAQTDAFGAAQTRGAQQGQAAQAEANAYRGIPTGTQDAATAQGYETAALNTGNFQANEMNQERVQRRNYLQQTLSLYGNQLTSEQARQLQAEIAAINASLSNQQMTNQNNQFYDQLGLTAGEQEALLNAQLIGAMSGSGG